MFRAKQDFENLGGNFFVATSEKHRFGTDSFLLCRFAKNIKHKDVVADFGTGCGILSILICKDYSPKKVYAFDILQSAAYLARQSVLKSKLEEKVTVFCEDIRHIREEFYGKFDKIICNPPYKAVGTGELSFGYEDKIIRHEITLTVSDVCKTAAKLLKFKGSIYICGRAERLNDVFITMNRYCFEPKTLQFCAKDKYKSPWLFLLEATYKGGAFLKVLPNIFMY